MGGFQITKSCLVNDKYRNEVVLKIDTVKYRGVRGGWEVPEPLEPPPGYGSATVHMKKYLNTVEHTKFALP